MWKDRKKAWQIVVLLICIGVIIAFLGYWFASFFRSFYRPTVDVIREELTTENWYEVIAENLQIPWDIAFLPNGEILITERPGTLLKIGKDKTVIPIEGVEHLGEGGLLGLALHPDFSQNHWLYLYLTTETEGGLMNRVLRYRLLGNKLFERTTIIDHIPGASYHDGGKISFGKGYGSQWYLFITTGDAGNSDFAQDTHSLAGKILRIFPDGTIPKDNPFGNAVFSYGHRNPQGITWDDQGRLWATEHGRSGVLSGLDELNIIEMGKNYGWPIIQGDETREGMHTPVIQSGSDDTWAPSGIAFLNGSLFFGGLRGEALYEYTIADGTLKMHLQKEFGRIRAVATGPDGYLYITTSNTDGRGTHRDRDDKLIRINPEIF